MDTYECSVIDIEKLRLPKVYRIHSRCGEIDIDIEMHEDIMSIDKGEKISITITSDKEECLKGDYCGGGYIVSVTNIEDKYRVVISIGGFLIVLKNLSKPPKLNVMDKIYVKMVRR